MQPNKLGNRLHGVISFPVTPFNCTLYGNSASYPGGTVLVLVLILDLTVRVAPTNGKKGKLRVQQHPYAASIT